MFARFHRVLPRVEVEAAIESVEAILHEVICL
jgi:hypothetical protein